jgi:hypothetical protein
VGEGEIVSTIVHDQVQRLMLARPIRDEADLIELLNQFASLRYLHITLPAVDTHICLTCLFKDRTARLPHLIRLRALGGASNLWHGEPFQWLINKTDLKHSSTPFHAVYNETDGLVIWL